MDNFEKFYNKSLEFLSYRPRSEKEVRDRLEIKNQKSKIKVDESIIDKVIEKLKEKKFLNDEEFARGWIESRLRFKPRSLKLIKFELKQKGIKPEIIEKIMINDEGLRINDLESAIKLVEKRIGRVKDLPKQKIYEKLGRFLASKGFGWDTIKKSIDETLDKSV
jgi:regulatory protein